MPITLQYGPNPALVGLASYRAGQGAGQRRNQEIQRQRQQHLDQLRQQYNLSTQHLYGQSRQMQMQERMLQEREAAMNQRHQQAIDAQNRGNGWGDEPGAGGFGPNRGGTAMITLPDSSAASRARMGGYRGAYMQGVLPRRGANGFYNVAPEGLPEPSVPMQQVEPDSPAGQGGGVMMPTFDGPGFGGNNLPGLYSGALAGPQHPSAPAATPTTGGWNRAYGEPKPMGNIPDASNMSNQQVQNWAGQFGRTGSSLPPHLAQDQTANEQSFQKGMGTPPPGKYDAAYNSYLQKRDEWRNPTPTPGTWAAEPGAGQVTPQSQSKAQAGMLAKGYEYGPRGWQRPKLPTRPPLAATGLNPMPSEPSKADAFHQQYASLYAQHQNDFQQG